ncbi:hypothetical protein [Sandaracinus amylolyticus]|uniref:Exonuclease SbcC n=1 Tax=Sandaracinus amylolyticus TaxID=927083 RepID=A0A0F6W237_9BACT|nr:hypothetical protein [Sandaracinus amylolyticus]AKF05340.1 exonuclease SbcC [Sandaracinus amylolyticus]
MSLPCDDVRDRIADGEPLAEGDLAAHLATCDACRAIAASLVEIDAALAAMPERSAPPALVRATIDRANAPLPAGRLAIAALVAALIALVQAPFALLRWLATPKRAGLALGASALGAAAVALLTVRTARVELVTHADTTVAALPEADDGIVSDGDLGGEGEALRGPLDEGGDETERAWNDRDVDGRFATMLDEARGAAATIDAETCAQLRALGYFSGTCGGDALAAPREQTVVTRAPRASAVVVGQPPIAGLVADDAQDLLTATTTTRDDDWLASLDRVDVPTQPRAGWWENTYVPGDPALRVLHARVASRPDALALAELAAPTTPALAAPRDAALALGVHADVRATEGERRVRVEVALRGIERPAGRRDPMNVAVVLDARRGLDEDAERRVRALLGALGAARGARDRVALHAAGEGGGELVALGALRHGEVEVALRALGVLTADEPDVSLADALGAAMRAAGGGEGAGLVLLLTPDAALDAESESVVHAGALAGISTTAIAIDDAASLAALDRIALAGHGRRRALADDAERAVRDELEIASRVVARAVRIELRLAEGVQLVDVVGSRPLDAEHTARARESERTVDRELASSLGITADRDDAGEGVVIYVPAFHAGASHAVLLDLLVSGPGPLLEADVRFKDLVRLRNGRATGALSIARGRPERGPAELRVLARLVATEIARALDEVADHLERGDHAAARDRAAQARARLDDATTAHAGLAPALLAERALLDRVDVALASPSELLAASLRYASRRHVVVPDAL